MFYVETFIRFDDLGLVWRVLIAMIDCDLDGARVMQLPFASMN